jgi:hypothetical protein
MGIRTGFRGKFARVRKQYALNENDGDKLMKWIIQIGAVLALVGGIGLAMPVFTTSQTKDVASLGDLKIQSTEQATHVVPWTLSAGALVLGLAFMGTGIYTKRGALA